MDLMGSLMLICAVAASLAFGVLVAYGVCQGMFRVFRLHAMADAKSHALTQTVGQAGAQVPVRG